MKIPETGTELENEFVWYLNVYHIFVLKGCSTLDELASEMKSWEFKRILTILPNTKTKIITDEY